MNNDNTRLWDRLYTTDPQYTKKVNQRGGFTAIDAYHQVRRMTEEFGPCGEGWGCVGGVTIHDTAEYGIALYQGILWYSPNGGTDRYEIGIASAAPLSNGRDRFDDDAIKKAQTDAMTKGMSLLGLGGDVFEGRFDDSKYVADLQKKKDAEALSKTIRALIKGIDDVATAAGYEKVKAEASAAKATMSEKEIAAVGAALTAAKKRIPDGDY